MKRVKEFIQAVNWHEYDELLEALRTRRQFLINIELRSLKIGDIVDSPKGRGIITQIDSDGEVHFLAKGKKRAFVVLARYVRKVKP